MVADGNMILSMEGEIDYSPGRVAAAYRIQYASDRTGSSCAAYDWSAGFQPAYINHYSFAFSEERVMKNIIILIATILLALLTFSPANASAGSINLTDIFATLPGDTGKIGRFESTDRIDLIYQFTLDSDAADTAHLSWDVFDVNNNKLHSGSTDQPCQPGANTLRAESAIPTNLAPGSQNFKVHASIKVGDIEKKSSFEIMIDSQGTFQGVIIEDVKLKPKEKDPLAGDLKGAAIAYTMEVDFRVQSSYFVLTRADIHWIGQTSDGFILDQGIGTTSIKEGFNKFTTDSYLAKPPESAIQKAGFTVDVNVFTDSDSATFPIDSLPASLLEYRARIGTQPGGGEFSVGEGYFETADGDRSSTFSKASRSRQSFSPMELFRKIAKFLCCLATPSTRLRSNSSSTRERKSVANN